MPEDTNNEASQQVDTSDGALDRAAVEGVTEEPVTNKTPVEETHEEEIHEEVPPVQASKITPEENAERSKLGRKLASVENALSEVMNRLEYLTKEKEPKEEEGLGGVFEMPTTPEELEAFIEKREAKKQQSVTKYETNYLTTLDKVRVDDESEHSAIMAEMLTNFNIKHSDNASMDARLNYADAERAMLRKKMATPVAPKVNLKGEKPNGTGVDHGTKVETKKVKDIELDPYAAEFVAKTGMSKESVNKSLTGNAPNYLRK